MENSLCTENKRRTSFCGAGAFIFVEKSKRGRGKAASVSWMMLLMAECKTRL